MTPQALRARGGSGYSSRYGEAAARRRSSRPHLRPSRRPRRGRRSPDCPRVPQLAAAGYRTKVPSGMPPARAKEPSRGARRHRRRRSRGRLGGATSPSGPGFSFTPPRQAHAFCRAADPKARSVAPASAGQQGPAVIAPVDRPTGGSARSCTRGQLKTQIPANRGFVAFQLLCRSREAHLSLA
jgi:hypothetical protein